MVEVDDKQARGAYLVRGRAADSVVTKAMVAVVECGRARSKVGWGGVRSPLPVQELNESLLGEGTRGRGCTGGVRRRCRCQRIVAIGYGARRSPNPTHLATTMRMTGGPWYWMQSDMV